ncbi:MAG: phosphohydrolase, partial [Gemmatimonadota bacterium]|nr:phosphohydrolase [Gemmatimonadota bacterium]
ICNVRDITETPPADWSTDRRMAYLDWATHVVNACRGANPRLEATFDAAVARAQEVIEATR